MKTIQRVPLASHPAEIIHENISKGAPVLSELSILLVPQLCFLIISDHVYESSYR